MKTRPFALLAAFAFAPLVGCVGAPCQTSDACATADVGAPGPGQALAQGEIFFAVDPRDGRCRPLPVPARSMVRSWQTCDTPCRHVDETHCIGDPRCQPVYSEPEPNGFAPPC